MEILSIQNQNNFCAEATVANENEDTETSSEGVMPTGGAESNVQTRRRSPRLESVPTGVACIQYRKTLHLLREHSPYRLTRRRRSGEIVMISKVKVIEKLANDIEPTTL